MRRHTADSLITAALRDLDPVSGCDLSEAERERADAMFAQIVASPVGGGGRAQPQRPRRRRRVLAAVALLGAAGVSIPALLLSGGTAYASWTPRPEPLGGDHAADAGTTCLSSLDARDPGQRVALAERRGEWTFVLVTVDEAVAVCLLPDQAVGQRVGGRDFFGTFTRGDDLTPAPSAEGIIEGNAMSSSTSEGSFTWVTGYVGSEVAGVTVHTPSGPPIEASVVGNRFAAWWPGNEVSWSFTVHLVDGTSRTY